MRLETDDTTFIKVNLEYYNNNKWNNLSVNLRARGNFRRSKCYFPPIKVRIKKSEAEGTLFEGNKNLVGKEIAVKIKSSNQNSLFGENNLGNFKAA